MIEECLIYLYDPIILNQFKKMKSNSVPVLSHLYQLYPNIPKYANDP